GAADPRDAGGRSADHSGHGQDHLRGRAREAPRDGGQVRALPPQEARQGRTRRRREGCLRSLPLDAALAWPEPFTSPRSAGGGGPAAPPARLPRRRAGGAREEGAPPRGSAPGPPTPPAPILRAALVSSPGERDAACQGREAMTRR